jgi:hypothetical protein
MALGETSLAYTSEPTRAPTPITCFLMWLCMISSLAYTIESIDQGTNTHYLLSSACGYGLMVSP